MPSRDDEARLRILEAYERAKARNPQLTQGEFMMRGAPGATIEKAPGKFKNRESAARYFRKIRDRERTGGAMFRAGEEKGVVGLYQVQLPLRSGQYVSQNMTVVQARSTFDIPAVEDELRRNLPAFREKLQRYKSKYDVASIDFDPSQLSVRTIRHQRQPIRMRLSIRS